MKVKNKDIVTFLNGIGGFKDKRFPVKVTYAINKNIKAVPGAAEAYKNTFDELRNQYMDKDAEGNIKYDEELREIEVDIDLIMLNYDDLEKCDSDKYGTLTVRDMETLDIMLK